MGLAMKKSRRHHWREAFTLILLVCSMFGFRTAFADWNFVPTGSMEPTLQVGDVVLTDKTAFGPAVPVLNKVLWRTGRPARGDIVTFYPPGEDKLYVKRVVGLPGDEITSDGVRIAVNGEPAALAVDSNTGLAAHGTEVLGGQPHLWRISRGGSAPAGRWLVPDGHYFMMGDHRDNSIDSRRFGPVPEARVIARVSRVALSFSRTWPFVSRVAREVDAL